MLNRRCMLALGLSTLGVKAAEVGMGETGPALALVDEAGKAVSVKPGKSPMVVMFISTRCPISNDYNDRMSALYKDYAAKGVQFVFVNANSTEAMGEILEHKKSAGFQFTVYKDVDAAEQLGAQVTPEAYVFDKAGKLQYRGHIDDARNVARVQANSLREALDAVMVGKAVAKPTTKAFGCTIKRARKS